MGMGGCTPRSRQGLPSPGPGWLRPFELHFLQEESAATSLWCLQRGSKTEEKSSRKALQRRPSVCQSSSVVQISCKKNFLYLKVTERGCCLFEVCL
ncbi:hypothetical protein AV530_005480 [Patagioenas fasciata monilis]|uniref:Uncharacterized protein n=1 Tax=Patagioenas fasciata monilis TaxID=372326 RepID=A0A1V4JLJ1_PATFA|nr:hypothetical protein AV530_005480 [Patagioenas fasciata monilis]